MRLIVVKLLTVITIDIGFKLVLLFYDSFLCQLLLFNILKLFHNFLKHYI